MIKLYSYYRSTAAYRIRIALNYKQLAHNIEPVNLLKAHHKQDDYLAVNPQGRVPTLVEDDFTLGQSMAILEYLEEKYPQPALLSKELQTRAEIRYFANIIVDDIHPLNNSSVLKYLRESLQQPEEEVNAWYHHWMKLGFDACEALLTEKKSQTNFCYGDSPSFADICLVPQVYNAQRFKFPMDNYPNLMRINEHCLQQNYFALAQPEKQKDFLNSRH